MTHTTKLRCSACGYPLAVVLPGGALKTRCSDRIKNDVGDTVALRCWNCDQLRAVVREVEEVRG